MGGKRNRVMIENSGNDWKEIERNDWRVEREMRVVIKSRGNECFWSREFFFKSQLNKA